ncbi:MAG: threonine--tRNA ligase [Patescibacteria group bacterium]|nr:threonine--tRNA ligase [Patescibacteria group bacterium]
MEKNNSQEYLLSLRHSTEHILMQAMENLYPKIIKAMGPATEDGFYFDFELDEKISKTDFPKIEKEMQKIIKEDLPITHKEIKIDAAKKLFEYNPYKQEWLDEIESKKEIPNVYWTGDKFVDLCKGPHLKSTGEIKAFKLLSVAGAYWHGDEKNKMLTRIYGTAFPTQKELDEYLNVLEKAKTRDHRVIGKDLDLFVFSDLIGKGLPLLTPNGTIIRRELERFVIDEETKWNYQHVITPPLAKTDLYKKSGHYPYYKDSMYPKMKVDEEELILRPMTCPHHFMLYKSKPHSYKELPIRYAEIASQFRYEKSGELSGLMRVRMFCLADAHIFASQDQAKDEIKNVLNLIDFVNGKLGLVKGIDYRYQLSLGNRTDTQKYYKDDKAWDSAENILRQVLTETKNSFSEAPNEAAFYGPKIDIQMKKIGGKEETAFTVQYDFVMPKRFELTFIDKNGKEKELVVIHRSSIGAFERTMAFLLEKFAGALPVWLSPVQVQIIPISENHLKYAQKIKEALSSANIRVCADEKNETMQSKIRNAQLQKIPYMIIVGDKELAQENISVRLRNGKNINNINLKNFITDITKIIEDKSLGLL